MPNLHRARFGWRSNSCRAINGYAGRMAEATGFQALYRSGDGGAANSLGISDLGISTMDDILTDIRRITAATSLPLLADADTDWGGAFYQKFRAAICVRMLANITEFGHTPLYRANAQ